MTLDRLLVLAMLAISACGTSASPSSESTSGSEDEPESTERSADAGTSDDTTSPDAGPAPDDLTTFAAPVRARLEALPPLPVTAGAPILSLTLFDASLICGFLDANVRHAGAVTAACPDGSPVLLGGECNPASVLALRHTFGEACALRFGDYLACEVAARESPCSVGYMRADLPECEAVNACLATQVPPE
jgi:hypothetical protein